MGVLLIKLTLMNTFSATKLRSAQGIWQSAVKSRKLLLERLTRALPLVVGGTSLGWLKAIAVFVRLVIRVRKHSGSKGLALYLKASTLLLMRALAGKKLVNPRDAGSVVSVTNSGIPRWIPSNFRKRIRAGDTKCVRFILTLCTLYRVIDFKGKLSISTVTDPGVATPLWFRREWIPFIRKYFIPYLIEFGFKPLERVTDLDENPGPHFPKLRGKLLTLFTSGPNSFWTKSLQLGSYLADAIALKDRPELFMSLLNLSQEMHSQHIMHSPIWGLASIAFSFPWCKPHGRNGTGEPQGYVGALSVRHEPGKERVFAMVDVFTQSVLRPLHDFLFGILKVIPQDGTFSQGKPLVALVERCQTENIKHVWSFDLSAATDRLPIGLQQALLGTLTSPRLASNWKAVLVGRGYRVPKDLVTTLGPKVTGREVRYRVGQPMGAYSSWSMLAMAHHCIVQFAAWRCGHRSWFNYYAVLGDDIVIADRNVAHQYLFIMKELGVKIVFHKSIISNNLSLEFAKRFYWKGKEVTPIPLLAIATAFLGVSAIPEVIRVAEALGGFTLSSFQISKVGGYGFKLSSKMGNTILTKLPRRIRSLCILITYPGAPRACADLWTWLRLKTLGSESLNPAHKTRELIAFLIHQVTEVRWPHLLDTLKGQLASLAPRRSILTPEVFEGYLEWWDLSVRLALEQKFRAKSWKVEEKMVECYDYEKVPEESVNDLLKLVDDFEAEVASIPAELEIVKRSPETDHVPLFRSKQVSVWTRLGEFITRPTNRSVRRKVARGENTLLTSDILRML